MDSKENQTEDQNVFLEKLLTENEILQLFGISKATLSRLRNEKQLPFCQITQQRRIYFVDSIEGWLKGKERTLDSD